MQRGEQASRELINNLLSAVYDTATSEALTAVGISKTLLPHRLYQGAVGVQVRYFPHNLPVALDGGRATFLFVQTEVEVVVVGREPVRLDAAGRVLDCWIATPPEAVTLSRQEASAELAAIRKALVTADSAALEAYGGINSALQRMNVLADASVETRWSKAAITSGRTWRSTRVPEWLPAGRGVGEAA